MKILVVCQYYHPEPFRISDICEELVKKGHEVTVLTGLPNYPEGSVFNDYRRGKKKNEILNGVKIIRCFEIGRGTGKFKLFLNYLSYSVSATLKALFLNEEFDVIFVNQLSPIMMGIPAMAYKKKYNKKILFYCLDLWPASLAAGGIKEDTLIYKLFLKISKRIYNSADKILVTSSMFKDYFENILNINIDKIQHLPQYSEDLFIQNMEALKDNKFNFVFAGNIGDMQSVETIIKAANELRSYPNIFFHIVGDGSKLNDCKKLTNSLKLTNITFHGRHRVSEMLKFYRMADAMLITLKNNKALSYTLPGKVQSYMAARKPIIGAINGETKDVIKRAKCGLCCSAEDYKGLSSLLLKFCNSNNKEQMGENSYRFYLENYSKEKFMIELEKELTNLEVPKNV